MNLALDLNYFAGVDSPAARRKAALMRLCQPRPLRRNVRFFRTIEQAEAAGFRACRRCDPKGERASLAQAPGDPTVAEASMKTGRDAAPGGA